jgi:hypothetical protein
MMKVKPQQRRANSGIVSRNRFYKLEERKKRRTNLREIMRTAMRGIERQPT